MVLAVAVVDLLPSPDGVLSHEIGLREVNIQNQQFSGKQILLTRWPLLILSVFGAQEWLK